jgi:hypothetical protein
MGRENAPCLTSLAMRQLLVTKPNLPDQNPQHSHDLAPSEFCLFLILKKGPKVNHLSPVGEIQQKLTASPTDVPNRNSRGSSTDGSTAVASVCVRARVRRRAVLGVTSLGFKHVIVSTDYPYVAGHFSSSRAFLHKIIFQIAVLSEGN